MAEVDALVLRLDEGVDVARVVGEFVELIKTSDRPTAAPLCILGGNVNSDLKAVVIHELTAACPSINIENLEICTSSVMSVHETFAIKCLLDSRRLDSFVVLTNKVDILPLAVSFGIVFTSAYKMRIKIYDGGYVDAPALLESTKEDVKDAIRDKCLQNMKRLFTIPEETLEVIYSECICNKIFLHAFSTRKGGCSTYPSVASLNLVYGSDKRDTPLIVQENRYRLLKTVGASSHSLRIAKAAHGNSVWIIGNPEPPEYDAIVCDQPGIVIASPAADCVMVLMADAKRSVCAVVHSGWKSTLGNVTRKTLEAMTSIGCNPEDIVAVVGPSIGLCCFEVGMDVEKRFCDDSLLKPCVKVVEGKDKRHISLQLAVKLQLKDAGILCKNIDDSPSKLCTFCNADKFFSYRRDGRPFGTHVGLIGLR